MNPKHARCHRKTPRASPVFCAVSPVFFRTKTFYFEGLAACLAFIRWALSGGDAGRA
jgi:hypothetical protein